MFGHPRLPHQFNPQIPERLTPHLLELPLDDPDVSPNLKRLLNFVRRSAETMRPDESTFRALRDLVLEIKPTEWRRQVVAAWALGRAELTEEQTAQALEALAYRLDYRGKKRTQWRGKSLLAKIADASGYGLLLLGSLGVFVGVALASEGAAPLMDTTWFDFALLFTMTVLLVSSAVPLMISEYVLNATTNVRREAARSLGSLGRAEGVPSLLRASQDGEFLSSVGRDALTLTLPSLTYEEHYGALGSDVVPNLCRLLRERPKTGEKTHDKWLLLLLGALEKVGEVRALVSLQSLIEEERPPFSQSEIVLEKARQVQTVLRERIQNETHEATLLRGAGVPVMPAALLRSYHEVVSTDPEQLVRAINEEQE